MGTFDFHSDVNELPGLRGPEGLGAFGLWNLCGQWTSANGRTAYVPDEIVAQYAGEANELVTRLVEVGLWERDGKGYRMLRGPSDDPNLPLPLWRYGDGDLGGRMFAVDHTPNN